MDILRRHYEFCKCVRNTNVIINYVNYCCSEDELSSSDNSVDDDTNPVSLPIAKKPKEDAIDLTKENGKEVCIMHTVDCFIEVTLADVISNIKFALSSNVEVVSIRRSNVFEDAIAYISDPNFSHLNQIKVIVVDQRCNLLSGEV